MRKYQYYSAGDDGDKDSFGINWLGQTFTPEVTHLISKVKLKLFKVGDPGTSIISIRTTVAGKPTGADLCSGSIVDTNITVDTNGEWYEITLGDGFELQVGVTYAIVLRSPDGDGSNKISWRTDGSSPTYSGGLQVGSSDSGVDWDTFSGVDCMFEEWGVGPPSPTTITWGSLVKSQISSEVIEEAISRLIQSHEDDADAHIEVGESLQSHKASAIIDHLVSSIIEDKILNGEVSAPKLNVGAKVADAMVSATGGDYTTIQDAIDAGKKTIFVKNGTYEISSAITILASDTTLIGEDKDNTIIKVADGADCHGVEIGDGATALNGITLYNIQVDGNKANQTPASTLQGVYVEGGSGKLVTDLVIRDCNIHSAMSNGVFAIYTTDSVMHKNKCQFNDGMGILIGQNCARNIVPDNICTLNENTGISVRGEFNIVKGNNCNENDYGIYLNSAINSVISNNQCSENVGSTGIYVFGGSYNNIMGNNCNENGGGGIVLNATEKNQVLGNIAYKNVGRNIYLWSAPENIVQNNVCRSETVTQWAILLGNISCANNLISNNDLLDDGYTIGVLSDLGANNIILYNRGYNPVGVVAIIVGGSPFTHTAGASPETIYITGGTVSLIVKGAITLFTATEKTVELQPYQAVVVTYSVLPTMNQDIN